MVVIAGYRGMGVERGMGGGVACPICGRPAPAGASTAWVSEVIARSRAILRWEEEGGRPLDGCVCDSLR